MAVESEEKVIAETDTPADSTTALVVNTQNLNQEALVLINQIIAETDADKTKDLTYLFNQNQNKKTMVRVDKLNTLLNIITDKAIDRFENNADEIPTAEIIQSLKVIQDVVEKGQKQINGANEQTPLIQINQQTNAVNVGDKAVKNSLNKESRDKVANAVMSILSGIQSANTVADQDNVIDATATPENTEEEK